MRIEWSPLALERASEIADTIEQGKPGAARRWVEHLLRSVEMLAQSPMRGRVVPEVDQPDIRELLLGGYRLIYRLDRERVVVLTARHGRRRLDPVSFVEVL